MDRRAGNGIYALIGFAAVMVVAFLVGALYWNVPGHGNGQSVAATGPSLEGKTPQQNTTSEDHAKSPASEPPKTQAGSQPSDDNKPDAPGKDQQGSDLNKPAPSNDVEPKPVHNGPETQPVIAAPPVQPERASDPKIIPPGFDHVRVEPNGENVFAGRVTPGATVEMVLGGSVHARAIADTSGLFALVAPPLPVGASHIYLRSIAPDGQRETSKESVTVVINRDKTRRPLVVLASPDKPTVVLSTPDSPDKPKSDTGETHSVGNKPGSTRPEVRIASIEARDGGRLNVSAQAAPGATVRLYINDVMVAPGGADGEGKVAFRIARGMEAGDYQVRLDDVDPVSGQVKSKAEVSFTIPQAGMPLGPPPATETALPKEGSGLERMTVARGDSLWRISERRYGSGYLYLEVYDANMRKIRNPDMIYPGQVLILPSLEAPRP